MPQGINKNLQVPRHIAIVMDGNRRWARERGLEAVVGHQKMAREGIKKVVKSAIDWKVEYLTLWAFSTENWNRDPKEIAALMSLFRELFKVQAKELDELGVKITTIGDLTRFDQDIQDSIAEWKEKTKENKNLTVQFALNYGGRDEILRVVEKIMKNTKLNSTEIKKMTQDEFAKFLDTANIPDPELIIRPGGEQRLSGFLLWQNCYSELYFPKVLMPDFDEEEICTAMLNIN